MTETHEKLKSDVYKKQYNEDFVDKWDELINWDMRSKGEGSFFIQALRERGVKKVLDAATGTGYHSIKLLKEGFQVHSFDGSKNMLKKAFDNAEKHGQILRTIHGDWQNMGRTVHEKYDAVICLGNSFTHLFNEKDRRKTLAEYYAVLKHNGILILDQRNYDNMLDKGFDNKHTYYYAGDNVKAEPEELSDDLAKFRYEFPDGSVYHLNMFPLRKKYTQDLLYGVGFQEVKTFGDFHETYQEKEPDYYIHVAEK